MRERVPEFKLYVHVLNSNHVFTCWFINKTSKIYNEDFLLVVLKRTNDVGGPPYDNPAGPIYRNTPFFFSPKIIRDWKVQYTILRVNGKVHPRTSHEGQEED